MTIPVRPRHERYLPAAAILLAAVATVRIVSTYGAYSHTTDEPFHIACGVEWLTRGTYELEEQQPPLARVMAAIGPVSRGAQLLGRDGNLYDEGVAVLYQGKDYQDRLWLARAGLLPFFWLLCAAVWAGMRRAFDGETALAAVFLLTTLPAVLAHAGLATTDLALAATLTAAMLAFGLLVARPSLREGLLFGVALAAAVLAKFSAVPFLPAALAGAAILLSIRARARLTEAIARWRQLGVPFAAAVSLGLVLVWAGYRFSWGTSEALGIPMPAPEVADGIAQVAAHNAQGHGSWLLGRYRETGFWFYYPVALLFKLPIPFLVLAIWGVVTAWRRRHAGALAAVGAAAGIVAFAMTGNINIGIRHVLPAVVLLTVPAAFAGVVAMRSANPWLGRGAIALLVWMALTGAAAHPDYLPYFNALAGGQPENVLVDSDLDWGQDMNRLAARLKELGVKEVALNPLHPGFWEEAHGFPKIVPLDPRSPKPGWNAVSLTLLKLTRIGTRERYPDMVIWTDSATPTERVGRGMLLFHHPARQFPP
jgi:hypothetical protein